MPGVIIQFFRPSVPEECGIINSEIYFPEVVPMEGISAAAPSKSGQEVLQIVGYSVMKQVAELQKDMLGELMQSMGIGQKVDFRA